MQKNALPAGPSAVVPEVQALINQAVACQSHGQLAQAEALYREVLKRQPLHADALNMLGTLAAVAGRLQQAAELMEQAVVVAPHNAEALNNLGVTYRSLQRLDEAAGCFERAVAVKPAYLDAWNNLGLVHAARQRHEDALASFGRAMSLQPGFAVGHFNRGLSLKALGRADESLACFDEVLKQHPSHAESWNQRADVLRLLDRFEDAIASCDKALALDPRLFEAHHTRGGALLALQRYEEALASYRQSVSLNPGYAMGHVNLGNALFSLKRYAEALASYEAALALDPALVAALDYRGRLMCKFKRFGEAATTYRKLLALEPGFEMGLGSLMSAQAYACDWSERSGQLQKLGKALESGAPAALPFDVVTLSPSPEDALRCAKAYVASERPASPHPVWNGKVYQHDRIRIAYLSADFRVHATTCLMAGLFEAHDKQRFEIIALSFGPVVQDAMVTRLKSAFDQFIEVSARSDLEIAQLMASLEIDIAVDLKGFTEDTRLGIFAFRPAPVQVNFLGYPGTTGAPYIDYFISDPVASPPGDEAFFTEKIVRLPHSYQVNDRKRTEGGPAPSRAAMGLPDTGFVFCCFNNNYKITPEVFDVWMRLLRQVPGSVLWLLADNADAQANLAHEAQARGVVPERLVFGPRLPLADHLGRHRVADLFLDTLPCNAHTTASDALWAGLPVLTCTGQTFAGRVGASLLTAVGLPDLVTPDLAAYEALALELATQPGRLQALRERLAANRLRFPLFDTALFCQHLEQAFLTMHDRQQRGLAPAPFDVVASRGQGQPTAGGSSNQR